MFTLLRSKIGKRPPPSSTPGTEEVTGLFPPRSAASLLGEPHRQKLLERIWQLTAVSRQQYATLYRAPLERYAEWVQAFPASESHHHSYPGGMLDHGLEIVIYALKLRQSHLLPPGAPTETQAAQADAWTAGLAYAALLHDIGKVAVDLHVEYRDGTVWHPWHGPLSAPYRFRYQPNREYRLHSAASGLLYTQLLSRDILDWLCAYPELWSALLYMLAGKYEHAGILGELVTNADQASVAQALGGNPAKALAAPKQALQRKLLEGLRYLVREAFKLNQPQASDGWLTQETLWLVSKTISDKLRAHLLSQGLEGIPEKNTVLFDVLQDHGVIQPNDEGKAIWRATVTGDNGWTNTFTFLKLSPSLIWETGDRPAPFSGTVQIEQNTQNDTHDETSPETTPRQAPAQPKHSDAPAEKAQTDDIDALMDLLSSPKRDEPTGGAGKGAIAEAENTGSGVTTPSSQKPTATDSPTTRPPPPEPSGKHFIEWLKTGILSRKLIINDAKALVHTVADTFCLISPGIFQRYAQEHPEVSPLAKQDQVKDWQWIQKRFERLQLHRKQADGLNIWTFNVTGPRKSRKVHGYLMADPAVLMNETPPNNPYLSLIEFQGNDKADQNGTHA
ncbi:MAG: TraI domain-containing protein [Porticoccaceae bacterium]|nr:TraI domain-containing protein [Porticoccaceae bacterium]